MANNEQAQIAKQETNKLLKETVTNYVYSIEENKSPIARNIIKALQNGADLNYILGKKSHNFEVEFLERYKKLLFEHPNSNLSYDTFLKIVLEANVIEWEFGTQEILICPKKIKLQSRLIEDALDNGAKVDINCYARMKLEVLSVHKELLLEHPNSNLSYDNFLKLVLEAKVIEWGSVEQKRVVEKIKLQNRLIKYALDNGAKIDNSYYAHIDLKVLSAHKELLLEHPTNPLDATVFLVYVFNSYYSESEHEKELLKKDLAKCAIDKGADLNTKYLSSESGFSMLEELFVSNLCDVIDYAQNINGKIYEPSTRAWYSAINRNFNIDFISNALKRFPSRFSEKELVELARSSGASHVDVHSMLDIYYLAIDFNKAKAGENVPVLSKTELEILDHKKSISISDCINGVYKNRYSFNPLSLALLAGKFELAKEMLERGYDPIEKNINGITPINIIYKLRYMNPELINKAFNYLTTLDIVVNPYGETLIDIFLRSVATKNQALEKTQDSLFTFFKSGASLFTPSLHPEKVHIAISMGDGFWSSGINAVSRLISSDYSNFVFHFVTYEMIQKGGDEFIKQFNGWINPGAADSFPGDKAEFNKNDWKPTLELDETYQTVLKKTHEFKIPYLGICAGAQQFVLSHDGHLQPVEGYFRGQKSITYIEGTLSHFMAMTPKEQSDALRFCEFPEITFKGDTAHNFAAVPGKLGEDLQCGATSEDNVPMSYAHVNGLRYATQFHPEHYYYLLQMPDGKVNYQRAWIENFIHLAKLHNEYSQGRASHPEFIYEKISRRLEQCMHSPTCLPKHSESIDELIKWPICLPEDDTFEILTIGDMFFDN